MKSSVRPSTMVKGLLSTCSSKIHCPKARLVCQKKHCAKGTPRDVPYPQLTGHTHVENTFTNP